jgi:ankyrin repeat protein
MIWSAIRLLIADGLATERYLKLQSAVVDQLDIHKANSIWNRYHNKRQYGSWKIDFVELKWPAMLSQVINQSAVTSRDIQTKAFSMIKWLIGKGANVNARSGCGWTPLHRAMLEGTLEVNRTPCSSLICP